MDSALSFVAAAAATAFSVDLWLDYRQRPRPHIAGYGVGITMFAIATWALWVGLVFGWTGPVYRIFFLFGAVLNIPFLALGSMFLVVGPRSGHVMAIILGAFAAISTTLTATVPFAKPLPSSGIPEAMFEVGFSPRLFAIIGGAMGSTILIVLSVVSIVRFWTRNRRIVWANLLIVAGVFAAASGGTFLAIGEESAFAISLLLAVTLIWAGYRTASGARVRSAPDVTHLDRSTDADRL